MSNSSEVRFFALRRGVRGVKALGGEDDTSLKRDCSVGRGGTMGEGGSGDDGFTRSKGCKRSEPWG